MLDRFIARNKAIDIDFRLLAPLLLHTTIVQMIVAIVRVTTSYRAIELGLSVVWLGAIAAAFALLPILIAVSIGRFIDRGHDAASAWIGSALLIAGCAGFSFSPTAVGLLAFTALLGVAHLFLMTSQQMLCLRAAGTLRRENVFGNFMVASAAGQGLGPFVVGWAGGSATVPPTHLLFLISLGLAASAFVIALMIRPATDQRAHAKDGEVLPVRLLVRVPGLGAILLASVMGVTAGDLIVIYLPLLGAERGIDVAAIGFLLTVRAVATFVSRALYARLVTEIGRWRLMVGSTFAAGLGCACLALPLPFWAMGAAMTVIGFALGISTTLSITMVFDLAAASARGTVNSLRIMGNRVGQLLLPFTVGLVAAATGVAGILFIIAASLGASALAVQMVKQGR